MRDPNRIDAFCDELCRLWKEVPDWRFTQFIENWQSFEGHSPFLFYKEDEETIQSMKDYILRLTGMADKEE